MNRVLFWLALFIYPLKAFANDLPPNACVHTHESLYASSLKVTTCLLRSKPDADPTAVDTIGVRLENVSKRPIEVTLIEHPFFLGLSIEHIELKLRLKSPNEIYLRDAKQTRQLLNAGQGVERKADFSTFFEKSSHLYAKSNVRISPAIAFRFTDLPDQTAKEGLSENLSAALRDQARHIARFDDVNVRVPK